MVRGWEDEGGWVQKGCDKIVDTPTSQMIEMNKIEEDTTRKEVGDMARLTSSQQAGEERSGTVSPQTPVASSRPNLL